VGKTFEGVKLVIAETFKDFRNTKAPLHHYAYEATALAKEKEPFEALTATEQITKQARRATETYFSWLQNAMTVFPWSNTDLNRKLLSHATENVTTTVSFMQKLSQAKNPEEVVKIQTEFMEKQIKSFSEQAKTVGEITQAAANAMTNPFDVSR
jgi:hypothetical protein